MKTDKHQHSQVLLPTPNPWIRSRKICVVLAWIVASVGASISSTAQARDPEHPGASSGPRVSRFSGVVRHADGAKVLPGVHGIVFSVYKEPYGGVPLWLEVQNVQVSESGSYTVFLGSTTPDGLPLDLLSTDESRYLGVRLDEDEELPRVLLTSVPYSLKATDAEALGGRPASEYVTRQEIFASGGGIVPQFNTRPKINADTLGGLPPTAFERVFRKGAPNGYPSLDVTGAVPLPQLPLFSSVAPRPGYVLESVVNKGVPNGYAPLDATGAVPLPQLPLFSSVAPRPGYVLESVVNKGAPNGYASLDATGAVPLSQLRQFSSVAPRRGDVLVWDGQQYRPQHKAVFEVRDYDGAGVDCTGSTDSSPFLNSLTAIPDPTGTSLTISTRDCPLLRADGWLVSGQEYLELDLGPMGPGTRAQGGTWLFGCSGSGAVLRIDRSAYTKVHGGIIAANSYKCPGHTSSLTASIRYTNSGAGGYTSTHNVLADTMLTSGANGEAISGYHAYEIIGTPNQEEYKLDNVVMGCNFSPSSVGFYSNDGNADSTIWDGGGAQGCYRMVQMDAGRLRLLHTNNSYNGSFSIFGPGGASIAQQGCVSEMVENVFAEGSGTLILGGTHTSFGCTNYLRGNQASPGDIDPSVHFIEFGYQLGYLIVDQNAFSLGHSPPILDNAIAGSVPDGGTGQVVVIDRCCNGLTNDSGHSYKLTP